MHVPARPVWRAGRAYATRSRDVARRLLSFRRVRAKLRSPPCLSRQDFAMDQSAPLKFGMGASPRRIEDGSLIRGEGRYTTDVKPDGALTAYVLRSAAGHARIT